MTNNVAGFWIRLCAFIVDTIVLFFPQILVNIALYYILRETAMPYWLYTGGEPLYDAATLLFSVLIPLLYFSVLTARYGCTVGKRLFRLRVVQEDGELISYRRSIGRYFMSLVSAWVLYLGYIMIAFSRSKQGLHDKACKTYVIRM